MSRTYTNAIGLGLWFTTGTAVLVVGLYFMPLEYPGMGFWESLYYTMRLFVFEYDLPSFPHSWPLIFIHFAAPAITLTVVGTAVTYLLRFTPAMRAKLLRDHVVICGMSKAGRLVAGTLKKRRIQVVGLDHGASAGLGDWAVRHAVPILHGDFRSPELLQQAGGKRARSVIYASGDDLANLDGAIAAYDLMRTDTGPVRLIWTHIASEQLRDKARMAIRTRGRVGIRFFDTYHLAASRMIDSYFNRERRKGISEVTVLGYGKFGHDLLEALVRDLSPEESFPIKVIDREDRQTVVCSAAGLLGVADRTSFERASIQELELKDAPDKAFFLCTDDDLGNLSAAMTLAAQMGATHIYVRMAAWPMSAVADHLGAERGVTFVNINNLMIQGIKELPGIFAPAEAKDLKRVEEAG